MRIDKELQEFRDLMSPPDHFDEGFGWRTVIMALFVGLLMIPSQMYLSLVAGMGMGGAAQWVTVILLVEIARRSMISLKRAEIVVLFYMCGTVMAASGTGLLNNQFLVQSESLQKLGLAEHIPTWVAPHDLDVLASRSFFRTEWLVPLALMVIGMAVSRMNQFGLGYVLFKITSDVERLPFPMAPVGAMGLTALADASSHQDTWRWRAFSIGSVVGIVFGFIYIGFYAITGAMFSQGVKLLPLPFLDLTPYTEKILPAFPATLVFDLGSVIVGMVLPFWAVVGGIIAMGISLIMNPLLYYMGMLRSWEPGLGAIGTMQSNTMDFYFSFGIGLTLAIAAIGFIAVVETFRKKKADLGDNALPPVDWSKLFVPRKERGDIPVWVSLGIWFFSTCFYVILAYVLINVATPIFPGGNKFPLWLLVVFGFVYSPLISYISARMQGLIAMGVGIPYLREAAFILSGYKGIAIWFTSIPISDFGGQTESFRTVELTGTKFTSLIKAELLIFPIVVISTILFQQLIWSFGPVPSDMFPNANQFWELDAYNAGLVWSSTMDWNTSPFGQAFKPELIGIGFAVAMVVFYTLYFFGLPVLLVYGVIGGFGGRGLGAIPTFLGALLGRYVIRPRLGEKWSQYRIVFAAGYGAGVGLITMLSIGFVFVSKSAIKLPV